MAASGMLFAILVPQYKGVLCRRRRLILEWLPGLKRGAFFILR